MHKNVRKKKVMELWKKWKNWRFGLTVFWIIFCVFLSFWRNHQYFSFHVCRCLLSMCVEVFWMFLIFVCLDFRQSLQISNEILCMFFWALNFFGKCFWFCRKKSVHGMIFIFWPINFGVFHQNFNQRMDVLWVRYVWSKNCEWNFWINWRDAFFWL